MANKAAVEQQVASVAEVQLARVAAEGSSHHPHLAALLTATGAAASRDLADAVHLLCAIHGSHPGLTDLGACLRPCRAEARDWLRDAADAFDRERLYLVRLTSAIGPMPSTPGAMQTENALLAQRHAIETLARSERRGCALGAATALVQDWRSAPPVARSCRRPRRYRMPACTLPDDDSVAAAFGRGNRRHGERASARLRGRAIAAPASRPARLDGSPRRIARTLLS